MNEKKVYPKREWRGTNDAIVACPTPQLGGENRDEKVCRNDDRKVCLEQRLYKQVIRIALNATETEQRRSTFTARKDIHARLLEHRSTEQIGTPTIITHYWT